MLVPHPLVQVGASLKVRLPTHNLCCVDRLHLVHPACRWHDLSHRAHLVGCITGDTNVVAALENVLDVADVELWAVAEFGEFAGVGDYIVDEVVSELEDRLHIIC